jgi:tetratricopeptide (TPR) repeat protein
MVLRLHLQSSLARWFLIFFVGLCGGLLASTALMRFAVHAVADARLDVPREVVEGAAGYFPNAPELHARLAAKLVEANVDELQNHEQVAALAHQHAREAVRLAPYQYDNYVLLAVANEMLGDLAGAETALHQALSLAPHRASVRWRLGNLFLRAGKSAEAAAEFQKVVGADSTYLPEALSLLWQVNPGQVEALRQLAGNALKSKLVLADFLVQQEQYEEAADVYTGLDAAALAKVPALLTEGGVPSPGVILDKLLAAGRVPLAAQLWQKLYDREGKWGVGVIWNQGFEMPLQPGRTQFDWNLQSTERVRVGLAEEQGHSGRYALKLVYLGKETTRLDTEIQQRLLVAPEKKYQVECFVKTDKLVSPDGPQVAVLRADDKTVIAASPVVANGTQDWQALKFEFVAPAKAEAVWLVIKQTPQFSYTEPTKGAVWFDDFRVTEKPL